MSSGAPRTLAVCADDFGIAPNVSSAIARLARAGRLTGFSCLVNGRHWPAGAALMESIPKTVERGLHLNLTEGRPLSVALGKHWRRMPSLSRLIVLAHLRQLPRAALRDEIHAQLACFIAATGAAPAFIDGHQHVHHLPVLRELILDMIEHVRPLPAVRSTAHVLGPAEGFKRWVIERTGGRAMERMLAARALPHNTVLLGAYGFDRPAYRTLMQAWLAQVPADGALLFCHPGERAEVRPGRIDPIAEARANELAYLVSTDFADDLKTAGVVLGSVWQAAGAAVA